MLMHKRLPDFDQNRRDKLKIRAIEDYEPRSRAARKLKQLMDLFRNDPNLRQEFERAKKHNEK